jgi:hypothetical protein
VNVKRTFPTINCFRIPLEAPPAAGSNASSTLLTSTFWSESKTHFCTRYVCYIFDRDLASLRTHLHFFRSPARDCIICTDPIAVTYGYPRTVWTPLRHGMHHFSLRQRTRLSSPHDAVNDRHHLEAFGTIVRLRSGSPFSRNRGNSVLRGGCIVPVHTGVDPLTVI